jgi:class 3 adenylate cyclase
MEKTDAERRQLTVMFCDLVDSTALSARLDPEDLHELLRRYQDAAASAIEAFKGHIAQYLGDGLLVYFGWPCAHDDDAPRAVHAALAVVDAVNAVNAQAQHDGAPQLQLRIGIHTGPVVVGEIGRGAQPEHLALGETPNVAARLQSIAAPGAIVVSSATLVLLEERFFTDPLGAQTLKGVPEPVPVYRVTGETGIRSRYDLAARTTLLPMAGRQRELGRLGELWDRARAGSGGVVLLSGEPGIGKSRLLQALKQQVSAQGHRWGSLRCSPYFASTPLYPVTELWRQAMDFDGAAAPPARLHWLERQLAGYGFELTTAVPLFADLLDIELPAGRYAAANGSAEEGREQAIEGVLRITLGLATRHPYLLVVEDLHWVDPTTAEMLRRLAARVHEHPMLAVYTSRPRIEHDCGRPHIESLELGRLDDAAVAEMLGHLAAGRPLAADTTRAICERADGVPAFVEALAGFVLDPAPRGDGASDRAAAGIPVTLRDSLTARLDRTGDAKQLVQLAATIGRWFSYRLIAAVAGLPDEVLARQLDKLVAREVLVREGSGAGAEYSFRHALMQELAYDSLLKRTRAHYHAQIAATIAAQFPVLSAQHPELLAHHYAAAGEPRAAIGLYQRASESARGRSARTEAIAHLRAAFTVAGMLRDAAERDATESDLQTRLVALRDAGS